MNSEPILHMHAAAFFISAAGRRGEERMRVRGACVCAVITTTRCSARVCTAIPSPPYTIASPLAGFKVLHARPPRAAVRE